MSEELRQIGKEIDEKNLELKITREQLNLKNSELLSVSNSLGWKSVLYIRKILYIIFPIGSLRRKITVSIFKFCEKKINLILRIQRKIRNYDIKKVSFFNKICRSIFIQKEISTVVPLKTIYYVLNELDIDSKKNINNLIDVFETVDLKFVQIKNKKDLNIYKSFFKKDYVFLFQYYPKLDFKIDFLLKIEKKYELKLISDFDILKKSSPEFYKKIFSIDYGTILNDKYNKNKESYKRLFDLVEPYAIYFPQFHSLKENNKTFYDGYHDMINLQQAKKSDKTIETPLKNYFGYYNLKKDSGIIEKQILTAKSYGFKGFGIYYYWFSHNTVTGNNMLMKDVIDKFFKNKISDFDVFFIYANENWTGNSAFNQNKTDDTIKNEYSEKEITRNFYNLLKYFKHYNYKKIKNKPVLFIHHPWMMTPDELKLFYCVGDEMMKKNGFSGLELILNGSKGNYGEYKNYSHHSDYKNISNFKTIENGLMHIDYKKYVDIFVPSTLSRSNNIQTIFYNFNNIVRYFNHKDRQNIITKTKNNNIELFKKFLNLQLETYNSSDKVGKIFLVNSWNEWGEQMAIEPSSESGFKLLNAFNEVILEYSTPKTKENSNKIICVGHDAGFCGAQLLLLHIIEELKKRFKFDVYLILKSGGKLEEKYRENATIYNFSDYTQKEKKELIKKLKLDGVKYAIANTVVTGDILGMLSDEGIKTISLIHELPDTIKKLGVEKNVKTILQKAERVFFPSNFVRDSFSKIFPLSDHILKEKISIHPQGLYLNNNYKDNKEKARTLLRKKLGIGEDSFIVLGVGSGDFRKGIDLFVSTAQKIQQSKIFFLWVGEISIEMQEYLADHFLESKNVIFIKATSEISLYFAGSDLYFLSSREDPFPSVVLEAMSVGVPVIAFNNAGGFVDIIKPETGILVPFEDTALVSQNILFLFENNKERIKLGGLSQKLIEEKFVFKDYIYILLENLGVLYKKVSVVVPNYNYAHYIQKRLDTIIDQTYPIYDLVILDDNSFDDSVTIIKKYIKKFFIDTHLYINENNSGSVFKQWVKGIEMSKGDFIWIAEADDMSMPNFLENIMIGFNNEKVVLSYSQSQTVDEKGAKINDNYLYYLKDIDSEKWKKDYVRSGTEEIKDSLSIKNTIPNVSATVFKKIDITNIAKKISNFSVAGDWFFYVWILQYGDIAYTAKVLNIHRKHIKSVTASLNAKKHFDEIVFVQDYIINLLKLNADTLDKIKDYRKKVAAVLLKDENDL